MHVFASSTLKIFSSGISLMRFSFSYVRASIAITLALATMPTAQQAIPFREYTFGIFEGLHSNSDVEGNAIVGGKFADQASD